MRGSNPKNSPHPASPAMEEVAPLVRHDLTRDFTAIRDITARYSPRHWVSTECSPAMGRNTF